MGASGGTDAGNSSFDPWIGSLCNSASSTATALKSPPAGRRSCAPSREPVVEHFYDVRRASGHYSGIVATISGFALAAVVLVITLAATADPSATSLSDRVREETIALATGFLVLGFVGCLMTAFSFAMIAGENRPAACLYQSIIYAGAALAVSIVGVTSGFGVLAHVYLPNATDLFALVSAITALFAGLLVPISMSDVVRAFGTIDPLLWSAAPRRPRDEMDAKRLVWVCTAVTALPVLAGLSIYFTRKGDASLPTLVGHVEVGAGLVLVAILAFASVMVTLPNEKSDGRPGFFRTCLTCACMGLACGSLVMTIPG